MLLWHYFKTFIGTNAIMQKCKCSSANVEMCKTCIFFHVTLLTTLCVCVCASTLPTPTEQLTPTATAQIGPLIQEFLHILRVNTNFFCFAIVARRYMAHQHLLVWTRIEWISKETKDLLHSNQRSESSQQISSDTVSQNFFENTRQQARTVELYLQASPIGGLPCCRSEYRYVPELLMQLPTTRGT
jgi:hypothetical protein